MSEKKKQEVLEGGLYRVTDGELVEVPKDDRPWWRTKAMGAGVVYVVGMTMLAANPVTMFSIGAMVVTTHVAGTLITGLAGLFGGVAFRDRMKRITGKK